MNTLHVLTPCSRLDYLAALADNFTKSLRYHPETYLIRWHVSFQSVRQPDLVGAVKNNEMLRLIPANDWVWILDDDNFVHPAFFGMLASMFVAQPDKWAFVFSQIRNDELGPVLRAAPENMKLYKVDTAQVVFRRGLLAGHFFPEDTNTPDGILFEKIYNLHNPDWFAFVEQPVVHYNLARRNAVNEG